MDLENENFESIPSPPQKQINFFFQTSSLLVQALSFSRFKPPPHHELNMDRWPKTQIFHLLSSSSRCLVHSLSNSTSCLPLNPWLIGSDWRIFGWVFIVREWAIESYISNGREIINGGFSETIHFKEEAAGEVASVCSHRR